MVGAGVGVEGENREARACLTNCNKGNNEKSVIFKRKKFAMLTKEQDVCNVGKKEIRHIETRTRRL